MYAEYLIVTEAGLWLPQLRFAQLLEEAYASLWVQAETKQLTFVAFGQWATFEDQSYFTATIAMNIQQGANGF